MATDDNKQQAAPDGKHELSEAEIRQESSKAANQALQAQEKANELKLAAAGAGDPEERQKLMEQAIDKQVEAESFGKTAKYLRRGTFQGMAVGAGLGSAPGLTLGILTGTLVGGVLSTITGGIGAGLGALVGWIHGPFWNMGEVIGGKVKDVTGHIPGWKATDEQKQALEKMIGQIKEEDMPSADDLKRMKDDGWSGAKEQGKTWGRSATGYLPGSRANATGKAKDGAWQSRDGVRLQGDQDRVDKRTVDALRQSQGEARVKPVETAKQPPNVQTRRSSKRLSSTSNVPHQQAQQGPRQQPRKLEKRSEQPTQSPATKVEGQRKPRKLEVRSQAG